MASRPNIASALLPRLGLMATNPVASRYPHLWQNAVFLASPSLGFQGQSLIDFSGVTRGVSLTNRTTTPEIVWRAENTFDATNPGYGITMNMGTTTQDYGAVPDYPDLNISGDLTLMCWARQYVQSGAANVILMTKGFNNATLENYGMWLLRSGAGAGPAGSLIFEIGAGSTVLTFATPTAAGLGKWYHYAITVKGTVVTAYRDGQQFADTQTITGLTINRNVGLEIGGSISSASYPLRGSIDDMRIYRRALSAAEVWQSYKIPLTPYIPHQRLWVFQPVAASNVTLTVTPVQMAWKATTNTPRQNVLITPAKMAYQLGYIIRSTGPTSTSITPAHFTMRANNLVTDQKVLVALGTARMVLRANNLLVPLQPLRIEPSMVAWKTSTVRALAQVALRDCGEELDTILSEDFIAGDFLVQAQEINLKLSFHYDPDGTWTHRLQEIGTIEVNAKPGGGIASVGNVTIRVLEDSGEDSILQKWESLPTVEGVEITIDFLADNTFNALRLFTGRIDSINIKDAVSEILCVDTSIQRDLLLPQNLITAEVFPNADSRSITQPMPIIYGRGINIPAAALLFVDTTTNTYLVAGHPMTLAGTIAVFDGPTNTYLKLPNVLPLNNPTSALITLGTLDTGVMTLQEQSQAFLPNQAIDGNSQTLGYIFTNNADSNAVDGVGWFGVTAGKAGYPNTPTIQVTLTNHRRAPQSDATTVGTFVVRTIDPSSGGVMRILHTTEGYRHVTSAQNNVITLSNVAIGLNELLEVWALARCEGTIGNTSQYYEVGEISITPVVAFSANVSGALTAIRVPFNIQDARFNHLSHSLSLLSQTGVSNASYAIDGLSTTIATINTSATDSNLDGIGELTVTVDPTSAQRGNNTIVVNMINHRRSVSSDPTVTGLFTVQTINQATGVVLRDNLFVTQQFRQQLRALTTSFTAPSINLGETTQLAVRLVARNEGGPGNSLQTYEVGDISVESFYQPQGDAGVLFLVAVSTENQWSGRFDPDGTVTAYYTTDGRGILLVTPDQVIASILIQELNTDVSVDRFASAHNWYVANGLEFAGGIGMGWSRDRLLGRQVLDDMAIQAAAILAPSFDGGFSLRPYREDQESHQSFDISNILYTSGAENQQGDEKTSTFNIMLGNMDTVHNRFEVHYTFNVGNQKYDKVYIVDENGSTLPESENRGVLEGLCRQSFNRYGKLEPMVIEAYWISDDTTAQYLLNHIVRYFVAQRITIEFETTLKALCLEVGDFITVDYPLIPDGDNGKTFEVHTLRTSPTQGRVQIIASRIATLGIVLVIEPVKIGWQVPGANGSLPVIIPNILMVQPVYVAYQTQATVLSTVSIEELWEFLPNFSITVQYIEGWER